MSYLYFRLSSRPIINSAMEALGKKRSYADVAPMLFQVLINTSALVFFMSATSWLSSLRFLRWPDTQIAILIFRLPKASFRFPWSARNKNVARKKLIAILFERQIWLHHSLEV